MVAVNSASIINNYKIGTIINQRKVWGNKYIERLYNDLKEYGEGYSYDSLKLKSRFAKEFTIDEIREQPVPQIPWGTIIEIMRNLKLMMKCYGILNRLTKMVGEGQWF